MVLLSWLPQTVHLMIRRLGLNFIQKPQPTLICPRPHTDRVSLVCPGDLSNSDNQTELKIELARRKEPRAAPSEEVTRGLATGRDFNFITGPSYNVLSRVCVQFGYRAFNEEASWGAHEANRAEWRHPSKFNEIFSHTLPIFAIEISPVLRSSRRFLLAVASHRTVRMHARHTECGNNADLLRKSVSKSRSNYYNNKSHGD